MESHVSQRRVLRNIGLGALKAQCDGLKIDYNDLVSEPQFAGVGRSIFDVGYDGSAPHRFWIFYDVPPSPPTIRNAVGTGLRQLRFYEDKNGVPAVLYVYIMDARDQILFPRDGSGDRFYRDAEDDLRKRYQEDDRENRLIVSSFGRKQVDDIVKKYEALSDMIEQYKHGRKVA